MFRYFVYACMILGALSTLAWSDPRLILTWKQPISPVPVKQYAIYKGVPAEDMSWVLVKLISILPLHTRWTDYATTPGVEWCYTVRAIGEDFSESENNPVTCGIGP